MKDDGELARDKNVDDTDRLKYLTVGQIREEIAYSAGADPTRYGVDSDRGLRKADVIRIGNQLQPADSDVTLAKMDLGDLYDAVCRWAGGEYQPNAGKPWGINRENLKRIHDAVGGRPPQEIVTDGGVDTTSLDAADHGELKRRLATHLGSDPLRYGSDIGTERHKRLTDEEVSLICDRLGLGFLNDETNQARRDAIMLKLGRDHRTGSRGWDTSDLVAVIRALEVGREVVTDGGLEEVFRRETIQRCECGATAIGDCDCPEDDDLRADGGREQSDGDTDRPDPEDDPFACNGCGCYIGESKRIRGEGFCDACLADMGFAVEGYR